MLQGWNIPCPEGFDVTTCSDAASALNIIKAQDFDFAVIDISLPDGNGFDVCKKQEKGIRL